ncbi:putative lipid II flippase FtsW [Cryobacterium sp. 10I1]|uniref:putative lipid II flippase FtsW n=1 Tax=unclassified Cryobacterium TaxID=2649013 RepID=UPI002B22DCC2|nr:MULTISPECIES: putative lipid II flippase FtsW [unclassified Cryobacterium]MEB0002440.1 putative lipid II flippase FtsW [Cryobacterium sp. RTC2.1]MEB0304295.1 putative lipid II flippase FtsW [Cryobacterium sp. 10I1]
MLRTPSADYFLLLGVTLFLVFFGLAMVLSSSSVDSYVSNGGFFGVLIHQGFIAIVGIPLMLIVSRAPMKFWQRIAWPALIATCLVQCLVFTPLGVTVAGNTNWLSVGSFQFQPSEAIKVALVIWLGTILAQKQDQLHDWRHVLIPVFGVGGAAVLLVMIRGDLGTTVILGGILFGSLVFAGVRMRMLAIPLGVGAVGAVAAAAASSNRLTRVLAFFGTGCDSSSKTISAACWQPLHGTWAMADGGIFGVGLGNSKAKWSWLPAADNDYIYAIIGEELGLIGAIVVLLLFIVLAIAFLRIMSATPHLQVRVTTAAVMVWVVGQALVNMGVVLGFIPVLGVPLPLISAGGTALLTTLIGIGVVLSFARNATRTPSLLAS